MTRYREQPPESSPYITKQGFEALLQEEKEIWKHRAGVTKALSAAAAEGDRSENAEYIYRKKQLREIDRRIRYLQKRLPGLTVVTEVGDQNKVFFGAWVTLEREDGSAVKYRVVGGDEIDSDSSKGYISVDSPMAKVILRKQIGDEVKLKLGGAVTIFHVSDIRY